MEARTVLCQVLECLVGQLKYQTDIWKSEGAAYLYLNTAFAYKRAELFAAFHQSHDPFVGDL
jgi:hypothetical protein